MKHDLNLLGLRWEWARVKVQDDKKKGRYIN